MLIVFGTGTLVRPEGWSAPYILTAAHVVPEEGRSLYGVHHGLLPLQLSPPAFIDQRRDLALFAAADLLDKLPGKVVVPLKPWPRKRAEQGMKIGVVGFLRETVDQNTGPLQKTVRLHSYSGTVTHFENGRFGASTFAERPYETSVPLEDARGMSGGPVFEVREDGGAAIRGVHYASFISGDNGRIIASDLFFAPTSEPTSGAPGPTADAEETQRTGNA